MEEKELKLSTVRIIRNTLVITATIIGYSSIFVPDLVVSYSLLAVSLCMSVYGGYLWARLKNRSQYWMFLGLLAPAGFIGLALLKDQTKPPHQPTV